MSSPDLSTAFVLLASLAVAAGLGIFLLCTLQTETDFRSGCGPLLRPARLFSPSEQDNVKAARTYKDERYGFSLSLPASWENVYPEQGYGVDSTGREPEAWLTFVDRDAGRGNATGNVILTLRIDSCTGYRALLRHLEDKDAYKNYPLVGRGGTYVVSVSYRYLPSYERSPQAQPQLRGDIDYVLGSFNPNSQN